MAVRASRPPARARREQRLAGARLGFACGAFTRLVVARQTDPPSRFASSRGRPAGSRTRPTCSLADRRLADRRIRLVLPRLRLYLPDMPHRKRASTIELLFVLLGAFAMACGAAACRSPNPARPRRPSPPTPGRPSMAAPSHETRSTRPTGVRATSRRRCPRKRRSRPSSACSTT